MTRECLGVAVAKGEDTQAFVGQGFKATFSAIDSLSTAIALVP